MWATYVGGITFVLIMFLTFPPIKIAVAPIVISFVYGFLFGWVVYSLMRFLLK